MTEQYINLVLYRELSGIKEQDLIPTLIEKYRDDTLNIFYCVCCPECHTWVETVKNRPPEETYENTCPRCRALFRLRLDSCLMSFNERNPREETTC